MKTRPLAHNSASQHVTLRDIDRLNELLAYVRQHPVILRSTAGDPAAAVPLATNAGAPMRELWTRIVPAERGDGSAA